MDFKTYAKSYQSKISLELARVEKLLKKCSNPDKDLKIIHVAGTNGKGSVSAFIAEGLSHMGIRCGKFSSPELFDITDTISVNGKNITNTELDKIYAYLEPFCNEVFNETGQTLSQFEINFTASLIHFKNTNCTHAVIECGMGGFGDATNAIGDSSVSVITKVSLDHMTYLGDTIEKITENKCGIFKKSSHIFTTNENADVMHVIKEKAQNRPLTVSKPFEYEKDEGMSIKVNYASGNVKLSLCGIHQTDNASLATAVLEKLGATDENIIYALSHAKNRARCEYIDENVLFDGAHNPDGLHSLIESINTIDIKGKAVFIAGFMKDKDYKTALLMLNKLRIKDFEIYTVNVNSNRRSEKSEILKDVCRSLGYKSKAFSDVNSALAKAKENADFICIFGSLYMYKEIERR